MKSFLTGCMSVLAISAFAQQNTTATGGDATGTGGSVSYSVGQIDYVYLSGSNGDLNQGVQQPYELLTTFVNETSAVVIDASMYPNPASEQITLSVSSPGNSMEAELTDATGKLIATVKITDSITQIALTGYSSGTYFLTVKNGTEKLKQFKLIINK